MNKTLPLALAAAVAGLSLLACAPAQAPSAVATSPSPAVQGTASPQPSPMASAEGSASPTAPAASPEVKGNAEACEHMAEGPAVAVAAVAEGAASAPSVAADHKRYDISLPGGAGQVRYASATAGELTVYADSPATLSLLKADGMAVVAESIATSVGECGNIQGKWVFDVGVGPHSMVLGGPSLVKVVLEASTSHSH